MDIKYGALLRWNVSQTTNTNLALNNVSCTSQIKQFFHIFILKNILINFHTYIAT